MRTLELDDEVYRSASETNHRNRELAHALERRGLLGSAAGEATDRYTLQCSLAVSARDLATMGATLADGGVNPVTTERVIDAGGRIGCPDAIRGWSKSPSTSRRIPSRSITRRERQLATVVNDTISVRPTVLNP